MIVVSVALATLAVLAFGPDSALMPALAVAAVTPHLVRMDVAEHRLPNRLVIPTLLAGLAGLGLRWLATGSPPLVPLLAALAYGGLLFVFALFGGMGMGDVKLAAALGLAAPTLGVAVLSPLLAFLFGGVAAVVALIRHGRGGHIAFGPFLLAGYFGALALTAAARLLG
jgi:leader peptidase (prepilin peptidase)/N-methyltransferase